MCAIRALLVSAALVAVCAGAARSAPVRAGEQPPAELRDCGSRGEGPAPIRSIPAAGVRVGPLVLWPSIRTPNRGPANASDWPFVVKAPVLLPARTTAVLAVAPEAAGRAGFQHGGRFVTAVRFRACRERVPAWTYDGTVGKLTGFPFAIGLSERSACIPVELWLDGRATPIRRVIPVGRRSC